MLWLGKFHSCFASMQIQVFGWQIKMSIPISPSQKACVMSCSQPDVMTAKPSIIVEFTASVRHSQTDKTFRVLTCLFKHETSNRPDDETWCEWEKLLGTVSGWYQIARIVIKALLLSHASIPTKVPIPHTYHTWDNGMFFSSATSTIREQMLSAYGTKRYDDFIWEFVESQSLSCSIYVASFQLRRRKNWYWSRQ